MAGHSKWANIKFRKMGQDAKRGKLFTKYIREITVAARGGADLQINARLRKAVDKALSANMTRETIDRAIKRGVGGLEGQDLEEIRYEGYAPGGVAVLVDCMTNNRNRTVSEVRHAFTKFGGNLGTDGSVSYLFEEKGQLMYPPGTSEEALLEIGLPLGIEDIVTDDEGYLEVITGYADFYKVKQALIDGGFEPEKAELALLASIQVPIQDKDIADKCMKLIFLLEELEDVQAVHSNADIRSEWVSDAD